jgi:hypothetical protein
VPTGHTPQVNKPFFAAFAEEHPSPASWLAAAAWAIGNDDGVTLTQSRHELKKFGWNLDFTGETQDATL